MADLLIKVGEVLAAVGVFALINGILLVTLGGVL